MQRDINFFSVYRSPLESEGRVSSVMAGSVIAAAVCIAVMGGLYGYFKVGTSLAAAQEAQIRTQLMDSATVSALAKVSSCEAKISAAQNYIGTVSAALSDYNSLIFPGTDILGSISRVMPSDIAVQSLSYSGGMLTLQCTAKTMASAYSFAHELKADSHFSFVGYQGATLSSGNYTFTVSCALRGKTAS